MAIYLQMDGVDDMLRAPQLTVTKAIIDFIYESNPSSTLAWYIYDNRGGTPSGNYNMYVNNTGVSLAKGTNITSYSLNGGPQETASTTVSNNTRYLLEINHAAVTSGADGLEFFISYALQATTRTKGKIYDIKLYNGETLVAHYDMSTGTVQDQSGNGKHGILTGGTFVDDGVGGDPGTDVSYTYTMRQSIYADKTVQVSTKQAVYAERSAQAPTLQTVNADRSYENPTKQAVFSDTAFSYALEQVMYADREWTFPMLQQIFSDYILYSADFPLLQVIHADRSEPFATKQAIYEDVSEQFSTTQAMYKDTSLQAPTKQIIYVDRQTLGATKQVIYADKEYSYAMLQRIIDPDKTIIGHIRLDGERVLYVYLVGERQLNVSLEGGIDLKTNQNFSMVSGDTKLIDIPIAGVDLSGASSVKWILHAYGNIKVSKDLTNGITVKSTGTTTSEVQIELESEDTELLTGIFSHEMEVTDSLGNVSTVMTGKATIEKGYIN